jgi:hypothetical protein
VLVWVAVLVVQEKGLVIARPPGVQGKVAIPPSLVPLNDRRCHQLLSCFVSAQQPVPVAALVQMVQVAGAADCQHSQVLALFPIRAQFQMPLQLYCELQQSVCLQE